MRRGLLLLVAVPLVALTGCGASSTVQNAVAPEASARYLASAAARSSESSSMKIDMELSMTVPGMGTIPISMSGVADNDAKLTEMTMDLSSMLKSLGADAAKQLGDPDGWKLDVIGDASNGNFVMYMHFPFLARMAGTGDKWFKLDLQKAGKAMGFDMSQFTGLGGNPTQQLDWLRATSGDVTEVGHEQVDGVDTTHYKATVELGKYLDAVPADKRAGLQQSLDALAKLGAAKTFPVDVWVDGDGRVRKELLSIQQTIAGQSTKMDMTMRFHDFGAPVHVDLPPADEVVDINQLSKELK